jgi:hypothetical protein
MISSQHKTVSKKHMTIRSRKAVVASFGFVIFLGGILIASFFMSSVQAEAPPAGTPPVMPNIESLPPEIQDLVKKDPKTLTDEERQKVIKSLVPQSSAPLAQPSVSAPEGTVNCFDYYRFGSVQVDIDPSVSSAVPGVPITFKGKIKNDNAYPVIAGSVYAKVFKKGGDDSLIHQNGYALVDQFFAKEGISIPAKSDQDISFDWQIPRSLESGDYQIAMFFTTARRFNLLGLSFTDDVVGNRAEFSVKSDVTGGVTFNKNTVTLNGNQYRFAAFPPHFKKEETVKAEITLENTTKVDQAVPVFWTQYDWDGLREENIVAEKKEIVSVKAGEKKTIAYEATMSKGSVTYLVAEAQYRDTHSFLDMRFVRDGIDQIRMNFPSITSFPLKAGEETTLFACAHSTNTPIVPNSELTLTLKDAEGNIIHTYDYNGGITGDMMGVKDTFIPEKYYDKFTLSTILKKDGKVVEALDLHYDCQDIDPSLCLPKGMTTGVGMLSGNPSQTKNLLIIGLSILALILLGLYLFRRVREEHGA